MKLKTLNAFTGRNTMAFLLSFPRRWEDISRHGIKWLFIPLSVFFSCTSGYLSRMYWRRGVTTRCWSRHREIYRERVDLNTPFFLRIRYSINCILLCLNPFLWPLPSGLRTFVAFRTGSRHPYPRDAVHIVRVWVNWRLSVCSVM